MTGTQCMRQRVPVLEGAGPMNIRSLGAGANAVGVAHLIAFGRTALGGHTTADVDARRRIHSRLPLSSTPWTSR